MDADTVWRHIHQQRGALAAQLSGLDEDQWEQPSLCAGWTVRDVAAHIISNPTIGWAEMARLTPLFRLGYNEAIYRDVKRRGQAPVADILGAFERLAGSRRHVPTTTRIEALIDTLVHSQDILRPLGLVQEMPPDAAAVAADRTRLLAPLMGSRRVVRSVRMVATDVDWERGRGPVVEAPMQELLMLCSGRAAHARELTGDGRELALSA